MLNFMKKFLSFQGVRGCRVIIGLALRREVALVGLN